MGSLERFLGTKSRVKRASKVLATCKTNKERRQTEMRFYEPVPLPKYLGKPARRVFNRDPNSANRGIGDFL
jgi:hypothetical protein